MTISIILSVQPGQSILIKSENSLSTAMVTSTSPLNPSVASMSSLKSFRKQTLKPRQLLEENVFREPTDNDRRDCILRIRSDPLCVVCHKRVWYETESTNNRLILMYRHIFRHHLAEEMKFDFLNAQLRKGVKNLLQCPICPELKPDYGSAAGKNTNKNEFCAKSLKEDLCQDINGALTFNMYLNETCICYSPFLG